MHYMSVTQPYVTFLSTTAYVVPTKWLLDVMLQGIWFE